MHVPLVIVGQGSRRGDVDEPVSTRRVFHTALDWAGSGHGDEPRGGDRRGRARRSHEAVL
jgi:hypothetical protein